ncbi:MAG: outer membrane protein assembly factor BamD [Gammaproteobacteria bacterium]|nr:outer membrane protein assembly factor BamD [Gammaproteobacteria bacterium]
MINRSFRGPSASRTLRVLCLLSLVAATAGCASKEKRDNPDNPFRAGTDVGSGGVPQSEAVLRQQAMKAYAKAHSALLNTDYEAAVDQFTQLIARYPFTEFATQAELEKVFAQYRSFKPDEALLGADRFLREHPRHKSADYVQYLKGLINAARTESVSDFLPIDSSKKDVNAERRAYEDFAVLVQRYPNSVYTGDARKRMIYLRNRIASHELSIVRFYIKRQAWVAVSKRAENLIAEYPGAPATVEALSLLRLSYEKLGQTSQIADLDRIIAANQESIRQAGVPKVKPGPRSRIGFPEEAASTAQAPATEAATAAASPAEAQQEEPKGLFGKLSGFLNGLNKSYTLDADKTAKAADGTAGEARKAPAADEAKHPVGDASLVTGPYTGEPVVVDVPPVFSDSGVAPAAKPDSAPAAAAAASSDAAKAEPQKDEGGGLFDFLNKSYTIGGDKKAEPAADRSTGTPDTATPEAAPAEPAAAK